MEPQEWWIRLHNDANDLLAEFSSFGGWTIESGFVSVWTAEGFKDAHRIPDTCTYIQSEPVSGSVQKPEPLPAPPNEIIPPREDVVLG